MRPRNSSLVELVRDLTLKVERLNNESLADNAELFQLREGIRTSAKMLGHVIDGPENSVKAIARGVRVIEP